jgi:hypothetical protein
LDSIKLELPSKHLQKQVNAVIPRSGVYTIGKEMAL